jgi:hypothetical protein
MFGNRRIQLDQVEAAEEVRVPPSADLEVPTVTAIQVTMLMAWASYRVSSGSECRMPRRSSMSMLVSKSVFTTRATFFGAAPTGPGQR